MNAILRKNLLKLFFLSVLSVVHFSLFIKPALAQVPPPGGIPCGSEPDPEFHSLRPYQVSPCDDNIQNTVLACGNDLIAVTKFENLGPSGDCTTNRDGSRTCRYNIPVDVSIDIALPDAELPILGNTQLVPNSQSGSSQLNNAERVNEYVSWYLNGAAFRAEEGAPDISEIVNFSGPIRKLLPFSIQSQYRINTIEKAKEERHNQITVCASEQFFGLFGKSTPQKCYEGGGSPAKPKVYRVEDWKEGGLGLWNNLANEVADVVSIFLGTFPFLDEETVRASIGDHWNEKTPPLEWNHDDSLVYRKHYQEWQGNTCIIVPLFGRILLCIPNPFVHEEYSELFSYIPLSSTEDRVGDTFTSASQTTQPTNDGVTVNNFVYTPGNNQDLLYFAHTEEVNELADILQTTFVPKGSPTYSGYDLPDEVYNTDRCDLSEARWNSGDDLFAEHGGTQITGKLAYNATFECNFGPPSVDPVCFDDCREGGGSPTKCRTDCTTYPGCNKEAKAAVSVYNRSPLLNEIWDRTVIGDMSIFKRIFPFDLSRRQGIKDLPGVTVARYSSTATETLAGNPEGARKGDRAEFFIPHLGGIYDYFLKGIQTALRPKDLGESVLSGITSPSGGQCDYSSVEIDAAINKAANKYKVPASLLSAIFEIEGLDYIADPYNYVCKENDPVIRAAGLMRVTRDTYDIVTCENERLANDIGTCIENTEKFSRCDVDDVFELAARTLLWKAGKWLYGPGNCSQTGGISETNKDEIYNAACNYYGSFEPDNKTIQLSKSIPESERRQNGDMNYCDIVCFKMGLCPPYP